MRHAASFLVVAALMLAPAAFAADTASSAKDGKPGARAQAEELRPSGPVTVKADRAEWVQNNQMKYSGNVRSEEHTSELQSLMRISYAVFCLKKTKINTTTTNYTNTT